MTIGIVGLGLMGGSLALALKEKTDARVQGLDLESAVLESARQAGAIEKELVLEECDMVFLTLYPSAALAFAKKQLCACKRGAVIVDFCGVKRCVAEKLQALCAQYSLVYIGAHPMAGREISGFSGALPSLYCGADMILCTPLENEPRAKELFCTLMSRIGVASFTQATPEHHDRMIAYTSQLAHLLSSAYIQNPLAWNYSGFTGGSFQDLTRVSRLNADMWSELFLKNSDMLVEQLDILLENLASYKQALQRSDATALRALMDGGTRIKNDLVSAALQRKKDEWSE